jgi:hypothetical protein
MRHPASMERITLSIPGALLERARIVAMALILDTGPIYATLDRRRFRPLRPRHVEALTLLPLDQA